MTDPEPERPEDGIAAAEIDAFVERWEKFGGSELANFQTFAGDLCRLLHLPEPGPSRQQTEYNDYVFERHVDFRHDDGSTTLGRIDLYKRGCFVSAAGEARRFQLDGGVKFQGSSSSMRLFGWPAAIFSSVSLSQA